MVVYFCWNNVLLVILPHTSLQICPHYNKGDGVHGSCRFATSCTKLHICLHFIQGDCKFGPKCKRTHNIDAQGMKLFKGYSQENMKNLYWIYRNKFVIMEQQERQTAVVPGKEKWLSWKLFWILKNAQYIFYIYACPLQRCQRWESPFSSSIPTATLHPPLVLLVHLNQWVMLKGMKSASSLFADTAASKVTLQSVTSTVTYYSNVCKSVWRGDVCIVSTSV